MSIYSYNMATTFPNGVDIGFLQQDIINAGLTTINYINGDFILGKEKMR